MSRPAGPAELSGKQKLFNELVDSLKNEESFRAFMASHPASIDDIRDDDGRTALIQAADNDNPEAVRIILNHLKENPADAAKAINAYESKYDSTALISTALMFAAQRGSLEITQLLLAAGADPTLKNNHGVTALIFAADNKNPEAVRVILDHLVRGPAAVAEVVINAQDDVDGFTALMLAAKIGNPEIIKQFLAAGADPTLKNKYGMTALILAADNDNPEAVRVILDHLARDPAVMAKAINVQDDVDGFTALMLAAKIGNPEIIKLLLAAGADPTLKDQYEATALILAADNDNPEAVRVILDHLARDPAVMAKAINVQNANGATALMLAARGGNPKIIKQLLAAGADPTLKDQYEATALILAADNDNPAAVRVILDHLARDPAVMAKAINVQNAKGATALILAAREGNPEIIQQLLAAGADLTLRNKYGMTALIIAAGNENPEAVRAILNHLAGGPADVAKAAINAQDAAGTTALMFAAKIGDLKIIQQLLAAGADPTLKNNHGVTALIFAADSKNPEAVRAILNHLARGPADVAKAVVNAQDDAAGATALMFAAYEGNSEIIKLLLTDGADLTLKNQYGATALILAADNDNPAAVRVILDHLVRGPADVAKAAINAQDAAGTTALMFAAKIGDLKIIQQLLAAGADLTLKNRYGATALILAADKDKYEAVRAILNHLAGGPADVAKAVVNAQDDLGATALMLAERKGNPEIIKLLLAAGANPPNAVSRASARSVGSGGELGIS